MKTIKYILKRTLLFTLLLCGISSFGVAQNSSEGIKDIYQKVKDYIQTTKNQNETLVHLQCDVFVGNITKYGIVKMLRGYEYNFWLITGESVTRSRLLVTKRADNTKLKEEPISKKGGFKIVGKGESALVQLVVEQYQSSAADLGIYGLVVTNKKIGAGGSSSSSTSTDSATDDPSGCNYNVIKEMKFNTTTQMIKEEDTGKVRNRSIKSKIEIDKTVQTIKQKMSGAGTVTYNILSKACDSGGAFELDAENTLGERYKLLINMNMQQFTVIPESGRQSIIYDMKNIKK